MSAMKKNRFGLFGGGGNSKNEPNLPPDVTIHRGSGAVKTSANASLVCDIFSKDKHAEQPPTLPEGVSIHRSSGGSNTRSAEEKKEEEDKSDPVLLSTKAWKRGRDMKWEYRPLELMDNGKIHYYCNDDEYTKWKMSHNGTAADPRLEPQGWLDLLQERATIYATYGAQSIGGCPSPFCLSVQAGPGKEVIWKLAFNHYAQMQQWLTGCSKLVAQGSTDQYNARLLQQTLAAKMADAGPPPTGILKEPPLVDKSEKAANGEEGPLSPGHQLWCMETTDKEDQQVQETDNQRVQELQDKLGASEETNQTLTTKLQSEEETTQMLMEKTIQQQQKLEQATAKMEELNKEHTEKFKESKHKLKEATDKIKAFERGHAYKAAQEKLHKANQKIDKLQQQLEPVSKSEAELQEANSKIDELQQQLKHYQQLETDRKREAKTTSNKQPSTNPFDDTSEKSVESVAKDQAKTDTKRAKELEEEVRLLKEKLQQQQEQHMVELKGLKDRNHSMQHLLKSETPEDKRHFSETLVVDLQKQLDLVCKELEATKREQPSSALQEELSNLKAKHLAMLQALRKKQQREMEQATHIGMNEGAQVAALKEALSKQKEEYSADIQTLKGQHERELKHLAETQALQQQQHQQPLDAADEQKGGSPATSSEEPLYIKQRLLPPEVSAINAEMHTLMDEHQHKFYSVLLKNSEEETVSMGKYLATRKELHDLEVQAMTKLSSQKESHKAEVKALKAQQKEQVNAALKQKGVEQWAVLKEELSAQEKKYLAEVQSLKDHHQQKLEQLKQKEEEQAWSSLSKDEHKKQVEKEKATLTKKLQMEHQKKLRVVYSKLTETQGKQREMIKSLEQKHQQELEEQKEKLAKATEEAAVATKGATELRQEALAAAEQRAAELQQKYKLQLEEKEAQFVNAKEEVALESTKAMEAAEAQIQSLREEHEHRLEQQQAQADEKASAAAELHQKVLSDAEERTKELQKKHEQHLQEKEAQLAQAKELAAAATQATSASELHQLALAAAEERSQALQVKLKETEQEAEERLRLLRGEHQAQLETQLKQASEDTAAAALKMEELHQQASSGAEERLQSLQKRCQEQVDELQTQLDKANAKLDKANERAKAAMHAASNDSDAQQQALAAADETVQGLESRLKQTQQEHEELLQSCRKDYDEQLQKLRDESEQRLAAVTAEHEELMRSSKEEFQNELQTQKRGFAQQLSTAVDVHKELLHSQEDELQQWQQKEEAAQQLASELEEAKRAAEEAKRTAEEALLESKAKLDQAEEDYRVLTDVQQLAHQDELEQEKVTYQNQLEQEKKKQAETQQRLREALESLQTAEETARVAVEQSKQSFDESKQSFATAMDSMQEKLESIIESLEVTNDELADRVKHVTLREGELSKQIAETATAATKKEKGVSTSSPFGVALIKTLLADNSRIQTDLDALKAEKEKIAANAKQAEERERRLLKESFAFSKFKALGGPDAAGVVFPKKLTGRQSPDASATEAESIDASEAATETGSVISATTEVEIDMTRVTAAAEQERMTPQSLVEANQ